MTLEKHLREYSIPFLEEDWADVYAPGVSPEEPNVLTTQGFAYVMQAMNVAYGPEAWCITDRSDPHPR